MKYQLSAEIQQELMQMFLDVPGLTIANNRYSAEIREVTQSDTKKLGVKFAVKDGDKNSRDVEKILLSYMKTIVDANIEGVELSEDKSQIVFDECITMATAMNVYLETNPEKLPDDVVETVAGQVASIVNKAIEKQPNNDQLTNNTADADTHKRALNMARQIVAVMQKVPSELCSIHDCKVDTLVNDNGSIEIGFYVGDNNSDDAKMSIREFLNCLDMACAEDPNSFGFDADNNRYIYKSAQEAYNVLTSYLNAIIPEKAYKDHTVRTTRHAKAMAFEDTLDSIKDDFVPPIQIQEEQGFSRPKSVTAMLFAFRTFLRSVEDTDSFYINPEEDKENGVFKFTIGCSEFVRNEHPDHKLEVMENVYDAIKDYQEGYGAEVIFHHSGDNIELLVNDIRDFLPFFRRFYEVNNWGGPEDVFVTARDDLNVFHADRYKQMVAEPIKDFDKAKAFDDVFEWVPMRQYTSIDDAKVAYMVQNNALATISLQNLEATILQEYEGAKAISKLSRRGKAHIIH